MSRTDPFSPVGRAIADCKRDLQRGLTAVLAVALVVALAAMIVLPHP